MNPTPAGHRPGRASRRPFAKDQCALVWLAALFFAGCASPPRAFVADLAPPPADAASRNRGPEIRVHDPSTLLQVGSDWWAFSTGIGLRALHSTDRRHWEFGPGPLPRMPAWVKDVVPDQRGHYWAPDVIPWRGGFALYYSVSSWGKNDSAIALATSPSLNPADPGYGWTDAGIVVRSHAGDDFNAIDPAVFADRDGRWWMVFGSFWSGIQLLELDPATGRRRAPEAPLVSLAHHESIEAPALHRHGRYYYLFVNWGACCRGTNSTYEIRVGRSRDITGPYLDQDGQDLRQGGGRLLVGSTGWFIGPGHAAFHRAEGREWMSCHYYDGRQRGRASLAILPLDWSPDGWPVVHPPDGSKTDSD